MGSGYFRCICCDMDEMGRGPLCDICIACDCKDTGDSPECRVCILDGSRGVYVPQAFAKGFDMTAWHVREPDATALIQGDPSDDGEAYWGSWQSVLDTAHLTDEKGRTWRLEQDGDLFAYCDHVPFDPSLHTDSDDSEESGEES